MLYLLADTGIRLGELADLQVADVDLASGVAIVRGKGSRLRTVPYSRKTTLWLGLKGKISDSGLAQMVGRRGRAVGIDNLHPHRFRHTFAHMWLSAGGQEGDLQRIAGWADRQDAQPLRRLHRPPTRPRRTWPLVERISDD